MREEEEDLPSFIKQKVPYWRHADTYLHTLARLTHAGALHYAIIDAHLLALLYDHRVGGAAVGRGTHGFAMDGEGFAGEENGEEDVTAQHVKVPREDLLFLGDVDEYLWWW